MVLPGSSMRRRSVWLLVLPYITFAAPQIDILKERLQLVLDQGTLEGLGMAVQLGVDLPSETLELASGYAYFDVRRPRQRERAKPTDIFLMGSTTKMYTAAAVLQLVQEGKVALDEKAFPLMSTMYHKIACDSGRCASLEDVLGPQIKQVTVRQLLNMRAGVPDFDDLASREYQLAHPEEDLGPVRNVAFTPARDVNNSCDAGSCGMYSSTNYELLGLILAQQAGVSSWDTYNQSASIPTGLLQQLHHTKFGVHGTCKDYDTVHGVTIYDTPKKRPFDVYNMSCTNGWACGNLLSSAADAATYVKALLGPGDRVLKAEMQQQMLPASNLDKGWMVGLPYGLGLMDVSFLLEQPAGTIIGHGGATYGFLSFTGYLPDIDVGFSIVANVENPVIQRIAREAVNIIRRHFGISADVIV